MVAALRNFKLSDPDMRQLRCLLHGPVGAGKSSFVNSVNNVFQGRSAHNALVAAASGTSFTKRVSYYKLGIIPLYMNTCYEYVLKNVYFQYDTHYIKDGDKRLPFAFNDVMGLEAQDNGMQPEDLINALKGHIPEGYKFNPCFALTDESAEYIKKPRSSDKVHCLVSVVAADKISLMSNDVIVKMRKVREKASELGIAQVVVMTMPDKACPLVEMDVKKMYTSKAIKEKMQICSNEVGIPMNCILPVKNYHEEGVLDNDMDILILNAMTQIMNFANDYIWNLQQGKQKGGCHVCCI
ncbi:interferon-induced protein 44-like [Salvelinus sp. IW2-2015]|uniref:interferon-induced protein 44-like n=1 Tax=Salvelinus sp. IW2-2015 TaxID=2691554 RepID=UPI000CDF9740|nr:interferon-induced protein 44-like [Salvelinus alpinus]